MDALDQRLLAGLTALEDTLERTIAAALERWDRALSVDQRTAQAVQQRVTGALIAAQSLAIDVQRRGWAQIEAKSVAEFEVARQEWARQRGAELVQAITADQRARIAAIIQRGADQGLGAAAIRREIATLIDGIGGLTPLARAQRIARTELHRAATWAQQGHAEELTKRGADMVKVWTATLDRRTRATHRAANGQVRELQELFKVGGAGLMRPGDPRGPAQETIQCRCVARYLPRSMVRDDRQRRAAIIARERTEQGAVVDRLAREAVELDERLGAAVIEAAAKTATEAGRSLAVPRLADGSPPPALARVAGFRRVTGPGDGPAAFLTAAASDAVWANLIGPWLAAIEASTQSAL